VNPYLYLHEDVYLNPGQADDYLPNLGSKWPFDPAHRFDLVGVFEQLRPFGQWPRAVNLWEVDWDRISHVFTEQFGATAPPETEHQDFAKWWLTSSGERWGGWDRFMRPGPGSPALRELTGPRRPCVVQQVVRLRHGALDDYLAWFGADVAAALEGAAWLPLLWLGALHDPRAIVYFAAESWHGLGELAQQLPVPDPQWHAAATTAALRPWSESAFLQSNA